MIPQGFKPNLAATLTKPDLIRFPVWASPKIDGVRCVVFGGVAYSRSLKPIPNPFVQAWAKDHALSLEGLDGELVVGSATDPNCMQNTTSGVMKRSGEPDFSFHVFDKVYPLPCEFWQRSEGVDAALSWGIPRVQGVPQHMVCDLSYMDRKEAEFLAEGYEGMMIRAHDGLYKFGRSTEREGGLVKVKRFTDAEAVVVGFVEEMHNTNVATRDALGHTERSTSKAGLVGKGTLGAFVILPKGMEDFYKDKPLEDYPRCGTGFTAVQRLAFWQQRDMFMGQVLKFKHFDHGTVDAPRHPVFLGFRAPEDMS
ncbi:hypothetical protein R6138_04580 [Ralstonia thomasii]|uniref:ATP-dependent DNA ligase n=1 Tax=Ralstonia thomasii TaxID=3058596 RepID=UPI0028F61AD7|nr:ATP-dependent DNA ligase [Ralstonia sp. LMG 18095]CAJ0901432.1 hypothetical protein R6138_04580 [Ralstonia sp. LMG 18095]